MQTIATIGKTPVFAGEVSGAKFLEFTAGLHVDADGSPRAYHRNNGLALDYLANAGGPGRWWGIATDKPDGKGAPFVQGANDPAPGFFVSTTSLMNKRFPVQDPRRYCDSETVPYIVLPGGRPPRFQVWGCKLGCVAIVTNLQTGVQAEALFADVGPATGLGEGSIALAKLLGIPADPKRGGTERPIIRYRVFPQQMSKLWPS